MAEGRRLRAAVAAACAYEVFALASGRIPTISRLCRRHRSAEVLILAVLIIHLHHREAETASSRLSLRRGAGDRVLQSTAPPARWHLSMGQGSAAQYAFTLTDSSGDPYPIAGATWEYVVRPVSGLGAAVMTITTVSTDDGELTVTATEDLSQVTLTLNPEATSGLPAGPYAHALWANPGTTDSYCWLTGTFQINLVPQP